VNDAPTITTIADQTIATNSKSAALLVAIGDLDTLPGSLVITGSSSNSKLVPLSGIVISGSSAERSVTIQPAAGELGSATVTVTVSDGDLSAFTSFLVSVTGTALERWRYNHYGTTMPQELLAPRYFQARGLEASIRRPEELASLVSQWLADPTSAGALRQRYQQQRLLANPARIVARLVQSSVGFCPVETAIS
jgi:hypothetical protein